MVRRDAREHRLSAREDIDEAAERVMLRHVGEVCSIEQNLTPEAAHQAKSILVP